MNYKKETLVKLLKLIEEISNQRNNEWFKNELVNLFLKSPESTKTFDQLSLESKINLIQEYLSIDLNNLIDYSVFEEPSREQLFRDNLEMMRFQKGTPNHRINFGEYCRYAHLQAEEMINYFLNKISNSRIEKVEIFLKQFLTSYNPSKKPTEIHHIYYTNKLLAFKNARNLSKIIVDTLWFINDFRNELSHRNSFSIQNEDKELAQFENEGFLQSNIDFSKLDNRQREIYKKGKYIITKRKEDFSQIKNVIEGLRDNVLLAIQNPPILKDNQVTIGLANPVLAELKSKLDNQKK
jgi:hypothetical protein